MQVGVLVPGALDAFRMLLEELYLPLVQGQDSWAAQSAQDTQSMLQVRTQHFAQWPFHAFSPLRPFSFRSWASRKAKVQHICCQDL